MIQQISIETRAQISLLKKVFTKNKEIRLDGHEHIHMIPFILKEIRGESVSKAPNPKSEEGFEMQELPEGEEKMTSEYLDTEEETEESPEMLEMAEGEEEEMMELASSEEDDHEKELKSKPSHTHETQLVDEAGLEVVSGGQPSSKHAQRGDMGIPAGTETKKSI